MTTVSLTLDPAALQQATVQAIMGVLTPEVRDKILRDAVEAIMRPSTNSWDRNKSPLELSFENAVKQVASAEALRLVREDEKIKAGLSDLLRVTAEKLMAKEPQKLAYVMAEAFVEALNERD